MKMNRKLGLFLVFSFLAMQVLSSLHIAEFGFEKHEHNDHLCQIYLHGEHTKYSKPSATFSLQTPDYISFTIAHPEQPFFHSQRYGIASPRAPPAFS
jgi:hypothetical protein